MHFENFKNSLPAFESVKPMDPAAQSQVSKEDLLAAEVALPVPVGTDTSTLSFVAIRPPFSRSGRLAVVDVSRLRVS